MGIWDKLTGGGGGKQPPDEPKRNIDDAVGDFAKAEEAARQKNIAQGEQHDRKLESIREGAGKAAQKLEQPGPSERMGQLQPARQEIAQKRDSDRQHQVEVSNGTRPPIKTYKELHPDITPDRGR